MPTSEAPAGYLGGDGIAEGTESAEYDCYECGEPVCGACSRLVPKRRRKERVCVYCIESEEENRRLTSSGT